MEPTATRAAGPGAGEASTTIRLLGRLAVARGGMPLTLPPSRKVRALLAYLAMATQPIARSALSELLWDVPNDPRGELRWCLSKLRTVLDEPGRARVRADADGVWLDLADCRVDALEVLRTARGGLDALAAGELGALLELFAGDFVQDGDALRSAPFSAWLIGQRRRFCALQAMALEHWVRALAPDAPQRAPALERWLQLAPFDRRAHEALLDALARDGRLREGDEHVQASARLFEAEGQDWAPIGLAWRAAKQRHAQGPPQPPVPAPATGLVWAEPNAPVTAPQANRASIAVMPFVELGRGEHSRGGLGDGLAYDIITRLAKLRSMFVIAQGTVFALDERRIGAEEAGRRLHVDYVVSGSLARHGALLQVRAQLADARSARVVWADDIRARADDPFAVLDTVSNQIVASLASQVELAERNRAVLKPPNSLDAWEAHHRGLWHMYRFNREDNGVAQRWFQTALQLDPTFSRPYAGLSFTHFQNAFLDWGERAREIELAYSTAAQGLMVDELDPAAHWAMGRALWLRGRNDESVAELETSVDLSPNFALGHYTLAFFHAQAGDPQAAIRSADHSRHLSPFDPLLFAMLASRALALLRLGRFDEAADWAVRATARPNAHVHIRGIAVYCLALAGRLDESRAVAAEILRQVPGYGLDDLLRAFRFNDDTPAMLHRAARRAGVG